MEKKPRTPIVAHAMTIVERLLYFLEEKRKLNAKRHSRIAERYGDKKLRTDFYETGYIFAPYIPLVVTPSIVVKKDESS